MRYAFFLTTYVLMWGVFVIVMQFWNLPWPAQVQSVDVLLLCLATFRITEIVTEEKVAESIRAPFCEKKSVQQADGSWADEEVPRREGLRGVAGEMILCPWCVGVWIATILTFFLMIVPGVARVLMLAFAVAAGGLLFQIFTKLLDQTRKSIPQ